MFLYLPYVVLTNLIYPITKLKSLSIIEFIAKKKATPLVQPLYFVGMGRLEPLDNCLYPNALTRQRTKWGYR